MEEVEILVAKISEDHYEVFTDPEKIYTVRKYDDRWFGIWFEGEQIDVFNRLGAALERAAMNAYSSESECERP